MPKETERYQKVYRVKVGRGKNSGESDPLKKMEAIKNNMYKKLPNISPKNLYHFHFTNVGESSNSSTSFPTL